MEPSNLPGHYSINYNREITVNQPDNSNHFEQCKFFKSYTIIIDTMAKITSVEAGPTIASYDVPKYNEYNRRQACNVLKSMQEAGQDFSPGMQEVITATACRQ
jgi:hypothetical protein